MRKRIIFATCLLFVALSGFTQTKNKNISLSLGIGGLISGDVDNQGKAFIDFGVINSRVGISIQDKHMIGYRNFYFQEQSTKDVIQSFRMNGFFYQYSLLRKRIVKVWLEGGYYLGNYCPCGNYDAIKKSNTGIFMPGVGGELKLFRQFFLEISFRHGFYLPGIADAPVGDFGLLANFGIVYQVRLK
ncbi:MAG: hypothetical protein ACOYPR_11385 [Saprospiraceae bacterium]